MRRHLVRRLPIAAGQPTSFRNAAADAERPVRPFGTITVEPVGDGSRSRVTFQLGFTSHGLGGKVIAPMARKAAARQVPKDQAKLKERLESGAGAAP